MKQENWQFERSSGYAGYRNKITSEWIYEEAYLKLFPPKETEEYSDIQKKSKEEQKQHIIEMMQNDEELGLYGANIIDQWLEKYGNPEITKQVEREAELYQTINKIIDGGKNLPKGFEVSRGQAIDYAFDVALEVAEKLYTEEDLHNAFYNGWMYRGENYTFPKAKKEWFKQFKKG